MAETAGERTSEARPGRPEGLSTGNWIAIGTVVLGGVLGFGLSEHNARLTSVDTNMKAVAAEQTALAASVAASQTAVVASVVRLEGEIKTLNERLNGMEQRLNERLDRSDQRFDRLEANIDRLLQMRIGSTVEPPTAGVPD